MSALTQHIRVPHIRTRGLGLLLAAAVAASSIGTTVAMGQTGGGTVAPGDPRVDDFTCLKRCISVRKVVPKSRFKLVGVDLHETQKVSFRRRDGHWAVVKRSQFRRVLPDRIKLQVPKKVISGPLRVRDVYGQVVVTPELPVGTWKQLQQAQSKWRFPLPGKHTYGDGFGVPRSGHRHQGMDIFASCGAQVVAVRSGKIQVSGFQGAAGNYVVLDGARTGKDFVFMHLARRLVSKGQQVTAGQVIGKNGQTGNASGCHVHFEIWTKPGWYEGGKPVDPEPLLRYWDSFS